MRWYKSVHTDLILLQIEVARSQAYSKEEQLRQLSLSTSEAGAVVNQLKSDVYVFMSFVW